MAPTNTWAVGELYPPGGLNNIAWTQPGGPGTIVMPQQQTSVDYFEVTPFSELTGTQVGGCGHYFDYPLIQQEYDWTTGSSVALLCCPLCGFVVSYLEPFEAALDTVQQPQIVI